MTTKIHAVFEHGVLRPTDPLVLDDGTSVELTLTIVDALPRVSLLSPEKLTEELAKIASLPLEGPDDGFSGADHDAVLYPKKGL